jgi:hypothetical protein
MVTLNSADLPPRVVNERRSTRKRTLFAGQVVYGDGPSVRDCKIRDLSADGAKITLGHGECVPTRLFLLDRRTATAYEARVSWIKAPDFGLSFVRALSLDGEIPADLQFLKRVWANFRSPLGSTPA